MNNKNTIYQFSIAELLAHGKYEGNASIEQLLNYGDFGLGTLNGLDGEVVITDGEAFTAKADGAIQKTSKTSMAPMLFITDFSPDIKFKIDRKMSYQQIQNIINEKIPSENIFYAIKIKGFFKSLNCRSIAKQAKPYPPITEIRKNMTHLEYANINGTLIGFKSPAYIDKIGMPGYHFHFIDIDKTKGGHLFDFEAEQCIIEIDPKHECHLKLEKSKELYNVELSESYPKILNDLEKKL
ncbi:MAG: acetolactate decarboxylase [Deltaproteobacteria bacterium]|nr:acetolactate decarboxylase [Deltaproteobacteria bacterium]